jgi:hypothetical protein
MVSLGKCTKGADLGNRLLARFEVVGLPEASALTLALLAAVIRCHGRCLYQLRQSR